eukprot:scaffold20065_cov15-Tisochrysis_lutea.AAC.1
MQDSTLLTSAPSVASPTAVELSNKRKAVEAAENTHHVSLPADATPADHAAASKRACVAPFPDSEAE